MKLYVKWNLVFSEFSTFEILLGIENTADMIKKKLDCSADI